MKRFMKVMVAGALLLGSAGAIAGQAELAWNASPTPELVTSYDVYYGTATGSYTVKLTAGNVTRFTVPGLTAGTKYFFAVKAVGPGGESGFSNEASTTIPFAKPGNATGLTATGTP